MTSIKPNFSFPEGTDSWPRAPKGEQNQNQECTEQYQEPGESGGRLFSETVSQWQQRDNTGKSPGDKDAKNQEPIITTREIS